MNKRTRFRMSQNAHKRLERKHTARMKRRDDAWIPASYHALVANVQAKKKAVLPRSEREKLYERCRKDFYN